MCVFCGTEAVQAVAVVAAVVPDHTQRLLDALATSRGHAVRLLTGATEYAAKQLQRHIDAMDQQIEVVNTAGEYGGKKKKEKK